MQTAITSKNQKSFIFDAVLITLWLLSSAILAMSIYQQYIDKIELCALCKWQRSTHILTFIFIPIGFIKRYNSKIRSITNLIFLFSFALASYHFFVQMGLLHDRCTIEQKITNLEEFMTMLKHPKVSCTAIGFKIFGVSATIYNALYSLIAMLGLNLKLLMRWANV